MPYCIYTGREVPSDAGNWDHVVPLSLGGHNDFVVWCDQKVNSDLGSRVDGKLRDDPLLIFPLSHAGVTGHRKKPVVPVWKCADLGGRPVQITWGKDKVTVWDARDRRELTDAEAVGEIKAQLKLDSHVVRRFLGKVALGTGYFLYGDVFCRALDCQPVRELATLDLNDARISECLRLADVKICDRFHPDSSVGGAAYMYRAITEATNQSMVLCVPYDDAISFHVGLVGMYIGSIVCAGTTTELPVDGDYDLGHAICLAPGEFKRMSFRALLADFYRVVSGAEIPDPS